MSIKNYFTTLGLISLLVGCGDEQKTGDMKEVHSQPTTEQTSNVKENQTSNVKENKTEKFVLESLQEAPQESANGVGGLSSNLSADGSAMKGPSGRSAAPSPKMLPTKSKKEQKRRIKKKPLQPTMDFDEAESTYGTHIGSTEEYKDHGVNPFVEASKDNLSTFSIDVDTASYTIARRKLNEGHLPPFSSVRVEEYINYFDYDYESPTTEPFSVHMEAMSDPFRSDRHIFRVGLQGKEITPTERPSLRLTFLVDVSGSMGSSDKLPLAKQAMHLFLIVLVYWSPIYMNYRSTYALSLSQNRAL